MLRGGPPASRQDPAPWRARRSQPGDTAAVTALLSRRVELGIAAVDATELLFDAEAQQVWLGAGSSLPSADDTIGCLAIGGGMRRIVEQERGGAYRVVSGEVSTSLLFTVVAGVGKRPSCTVCVKEHLVEGTPEERRVAQWAAWWAGALDRLERQVAVVRRRRIPAQAVVVIHGIGEQIPGETLRSFVAGTMGDTGPAVRSKPDHISTTYELRRMSMAARDAYPKTDFFELYWAHHIRDTTTPQVLWWLLRLMVRRPGAIPPALRPVWTGLLLSTVLVVVAAVVGVTRWSGTDIPAWLTALAGLSPLLLAGVSWMLIRILGDAARYLSPAPGNVAVRDRIRGDGVRLLADLHRSNRYDRIVIVGHSLGSVIAYDIVTHLYAMLHLDHRGPRKAPRKRAQALHAYRGDDPMVAQDLQYAAWEEARRATQPWLITDLVTVGSPLTHADFLLTSKDRSLDDLQEARQLPTCPPVRDEGPDKADKKEKAFFRHAEYVTRDGRNATFLYFHHAAPFATTRWTNLYVPVRWGVLGDVVGGPLRPHFGDWVNDVSVVSPYALAHTRYWILGRGGAKSDHIEPVRQALRLWRREDLEKLAATIPPTAQLDPPRFGPMRDRDRVVDNRDPP